MQYTKPASSLTAGAARRGPQRVKRWGLVLALASIAVSAAFAQNATPQQEVDWLSELANNGNTGAQLELGLAYHDGSDDLIADPATALHWLTKAAEGGNAYAANLVGDAYAQGLGTTADPAIARHWWEIAAAAGNADARRRLGEDGPSALDEAVDALDGKTIQDQSPASLLKHARNGDATAQYQLAVRYRDGAYGLPQDARLSHRWMQRAAAGGNPEARAELQGSAATADH